ncbi:U4/U6 small nuclear ribonucleoprotein Prp4-like [Sycon ciliatum]|uniref:U4/U6 small nuclear ribonucleoprotein Prp4-like n=1 Tax=Sycon ciliatum TaxID=27933 RepID=UPI0020AC4D37|eukprot:scpid58806/ scgid20259/ U4/U6 small nuclear ribonucleoprotein Prp4; PRP4 homolog; U4/U6 snRNP 60 kDa protein; WD splicing factor Prp4
MSNAAGPPPAKRPVHVDVNDTEIAAGISKGNINISSGDTVNISQDFAADRRDAMVAEFERRRKARLVTVPTDDAEVKARLRSMGEPICLFGEGPAHRRDRLRELLAERGETFNSAAERQAEDETKAKVEQQTEVWYHEGPAELQAARRFIANYSLPRANQRLKHSRIQQARPDPEKYAKTQELHKTLRSLVSTASQIGDDRPLSFCRFSPDSKMLATCSWSGLCKLWSVPQCEEIRVLRGHNTRVGSIAFHPQATLSLSPTCANMASCDADGVVRLWNLESDTPIESIGDHDQRVARVEYHPSGRFIASTCFDNSWRLWDLEHNMELLFQEGHTAPVYSVSFQCDGSLVATGGMDACGRVWDLRTGRCVMLCDGHLKSVLAIDFSPNGYTLATGSEDNSVSIWDLRKKECVSNLPAHTNLVSGVVYEPNEGGYLVTSSYDNFIKVWSSTTSAPLKTLGGHTGRVMSVDISPNREFIASVSYDRTFKLWSPE